MTLRTHGSGSIHPLYFYGNLKSNFLGSVVADTYIDRRGFYNVTRENGQFKQWYGKYDTNSWVENTNRYVEDVYGTNLSNSDILDIAIGSVNAPVLGVFRKLSDRIQHETVQQGDISPTVQNTYYVTSVPAGTVSVQSYDGYMLAHVYVNNNFELHRVAPGGNIWENVSTVVAEDNVNYIGADSSFWDTIRYAVIKENDPPTTPGSFTKPTSGTTLKGDVDTTFEFGASTDSNGDTISYRIESSIDNGSTWKYEGYAQYNWFTVKPNAYTGTATQLRVRVRAEDTAGGVSSYSTSSNYAVSHNSAPTTPGTFTSPASGQVLEEGSTQTVSWGSSSDADGNLSYYQLEQSVNGGTWSTVGTNDLTTSRSVTIPTGTSIAFRVKAVDTGGLSSSYRTSETYTVQPPQYYWGKYNTAETQSPNYAEELYKSFTRDYFSDYTAMSGGSRYTSYYISGSVFKGSGTYALLSTHLQAQAPPFTKDLYHIYIDPTANEEVLEKDTWVVHADGSGYVDRNSYRLVEDGTYTTIYSKGSLIQDGITASYNAYTHDAKNSDGYWWVRGSTVATNAIPTIAATTGTGLSISQNQSFLISDKVGFDFNIIPTDSDSGDTIQSYWDLGSTVKQSYQSSTSGTTYSYNVTFDELVLGNNPINVKVKDSSGTESILAFTLRNKTPKTLSPKTAFDAVKALGYTNTASGDLRALMPTNYTGPLSVKDIIDYLK